MRRPVLVLSVSLFHSFACSSSEPDGSSANTGASAAGASSTTASTSTTGASTGGDTAGAATTTTVADTGTGTQNTGTMDTTTNASTGTDGATAAGGAGTATSTAGAGAGAVASGGTAGSSMADDSMDLSAAGAVAMGGAGGAGGASNAAEAGATGMTGGASNSGDAGASNMGGGSSGDDGTMSFFVTSRGMDDGGNLGGLEGADAFCQELASDVGAGDKTWRAYLSTDSENARDRIGMGPWRNQAGEIVANDLEQLHDQGEGGALDSTWPPADLSVALDETGAEVENAVHDILTGTLEDGSAAPSTCQNWTSSSSDDSGQVGHSNRDGGGRPPSFSTTHEVGCGPDTGENYSSGTVTQGGGRGSLYCFAL